MVSEETTAKSFPGLFGRAVDGAGSEGSVGKEITCVVPLNSTIYVSILDPLGELAFKPRPTKPIPQWMQRVPRKRHSKPQNEQCSVSTLDEHHRDTTSTSAKPPHTSDPLTICLTRPRSPRLHTPPPSLRHRRSRARDAFRNPVDTSQERIVIPSHSPSFVTSETPKRPSSRLTEEVIPGGSSPNRPCRADYRAGSPSQALTSRPNTPARKTAHPARTARTQQPTHQEAAERARDRNNTRSPRSQHNRSSSPLAEAAMPRIVRKTPPTESDECLYLYKPVQTERDARYQTSMSSIAVAGRKGGRRVEREDFDAMIRGTGGGGRQAARAAARTKARKLGGDSPE